MGLDFRLGVGRGGSRANRGGSWNNTPRRVRSANRNRNTPDNRNDNLGFRLAQATRDRQSRHLQGDVGCVRGNP
ncbi:MAG: hypothetical protein EOM10_11230 [Opitutae bacterium]|nr:hypothetical protein [Opitutae bacterium]